MGPFNFSPFPVLSTDRLLLREMTMEDDQEVFDLRSNPQVLQFIEITKAVVIEDAQKFIENVNEGMLKQEAIMWAITLKDSERLIGTICLWNISVERMEAEVGYMLHPDFQGKGIMQEALIEVIDYGFSSMHLNVIVADLHPDNIKSVNVLQKNGFVYFGKSKDLIVYSLKRPNLNAGY